MDTTINTQDLNLSDLELQDDDKAILSQIDDNIISNDSQSDTIDINDNENYTEINNDNNEENNIIEEDNANINENINNDNKEDIEFLDNNIVENEEEENINKENIDKDNNEDIEFLDNNITEENNNEEVLDNNIIHEDIIDINDEEDNNDEDINLDAIQNKILTLNASSSDNKKEILKVLAKAGITANISIKTTASSNRVHDKLLYEDENDKTLATCRANSMHVFDITELTEEEQKEAKKYGLCKHCLNILQQANEIKQAIGQVRLSSNKSSTTSNINKGISAGQQIRKMFTNAISLYSDKDLMNFTDKTYSLQYFKLAYPLLLDITNKTAAEIKILKLDKKGHPRYSPRIYSINNHQFHKIHHQR